MALKYITLVFGCRNLVLGSPHIASGEIALCLTWFVSQRASSWGFCWLTQLALNLGQDSLRQQYTTSSSSRGTIFSSTITWSTCFPTSELWSKTPSFLWNFRYHNKKTCWQTDRFYWPWGGWWGGWDQNHSPEFFRRCKEMASKFGK